MRLIDADKFQKDLSSVWKWLVERDNRGYGTTHGETLNKIHDILINQPTAYNVDAVVEELETYKAKHMGSDGHYISIINKAIEIIRNGGVVNE